MPWQINRKRKLNQNTFQTFNGYHFDGVFFVCAMVWFACHSCQFLVWNAWFFWTIDTNWMSIFPFEPCLQSHIFHQCNASLLITKKHLASALIGSQAKFGKGFISVRNFIFWMGSGKWLGRKSKIELTKMNRKFMRILMKMKIKPFLEAMAVERSHYEFVCLFTDERIGHKRDI